MSMHDVASYTERLKKVPIFDRIPSRELEYIARSVKERVYEPGTEIVKEGDPGPGFFLITEGQVDVWHRDHKIRDMGPGEFFGEMALMEERPRSATVKARTRTTCLQLVRWDFRALLKDNPDLAVKMLEVVVQRLREHPGLEATSMRTELRTLDDGQILRLFRELFAITLDEVDRTGISRSTWVRIESGEERAHRPGVQQRLQLIRAFLEVVGQLPYVEARAWVERPLRGINRTPHQLALSPTGLGYLVSRLRSRGEQTAT